MSDTRIAELLAYAYEGEVIGGYLFSALADQPSWSAGHEVGLRTAAALEHQTRVMLEPLLAARGVERLTDAEGERSASNYVAQVTAKSWTEWCSALIEWSADARGKFIELASLVPDEERDRVAQLVAHEDVLIAFAEAARGSDDEASVEILSDHIRAFAMPDVSP